VSQSTGPSSATARATALLERPASKFTAAQVAVERHDGWVTAAPIGDEFDALCDLVAAGGVVVLSGAGLSTESGIPDYRGPSSAARRHTPMTYQAFVGSPEARQRYWARSYLGWRQIARAEPNDGHRAVAAMQASGHVAGVIIQNVDGLHQAAGTRDVIELHGGLGRVVCLSCGCGEERTSLGDRLREANAGFDAYVARINPDGDAEIDDADLASFTVPTCMLCRSDLLKPDVVFFGENVPRERVNACYRLVDAARSLLVLGSSLQVMSGLRFVRRAAANGVPIAIINQGPTRGDDFATFKLDAPLGATLRALQVGVRDGRVGEAIGIDDRSRLDERLDRVGHIPHVDVHRGKQPVGVVEPERDELAVRNIATNH
jgi:NAD-dependent SIR2 family protein deacetylase